MNAARCRVAAVALCTFLLPGCALVSPVNVDTKKYVLSSIPADLPATPTQPVTLLVLPPEAKPIYATTQMAYTIKAYEVAYFSQNEWAETPSQMIQPLIVETLRRTGQFSEVLPSPHFARHTFVLRTEIIELKQDFTSDPAALRLALRFTLSREATNQVIAARTLALQEPMQERTPYAGVVAANAAMEKLLRAFAGFMTEKAR